MNKRKMLINNVFKILKQEIDKEGCYFVSIKLRDEFYNILTDKLLQFKDELKIKPFEKLLTIPESIILKIISDDEFIKSIHDYTVHSDINTMKTALYGMMTFDSKLLRLLYGKLTN